MGIHKLCLGFTALALPGAGGGGLAVRPIIRQHYVRFQNAKAVTGWSFPARLFALDDDIVRIMG